MTWWWNLPFALFLLLAFLCRVRPGAGLSRGVVALLGFFGVPSSAAWRAPAELFAIAGSAGLVFVGWADQLAAVPDGWMLADAVLSALGLGLAGAWILARLSDASGPHDRTATPREMTMMDVEELPQRGPPPLP